MKLYNSLTRQVEEVTSKNGVINIYACGPTVYNYIHLGNARPNITMDLIVRFLEHKNFKVNYLQNITDIDDKIINKAKEEGGEELELSNFFTEKYFEDLENLNVKKPTKVMKVSDNIDGIIDFIKRMIDNGSAYISDGDVFFDIEKYKDEYGKLSGRKIDELIVGARVGENLKKDNPLDFALWKQTNEGIKWETPFGTGRPGWHTECCLLIEKYFNGETIDMHAGGIDLKFPHHENERIQFMAVNNKEIANSWVHNGHLTFDNEKMSKSLGNTIVVKDFLENNHPDLLRWLFMTTPYTQPIDINDDILEQGKKFLSKLENINKKAKQLFALDELQDNTTVESINNYVDKFDDFMNDNLNTTNVLTLIESAIKEVNKDLSNKEINSNFIELKEILKVLGFKFDLNPIVEVEDKKLFKKWKELINDKDFEKADELREQLIEKGLM